MADYCFRPRLIFPNVLRVSKEGKGIEPYFHCNCEGFRVIGFDPCVQFELCLDGQKKYPTNRKRAFDPSDQRLIFRNGGGGN